MTKITIEIVAVDDAAAVRMLARMDGMLSALPDPRELPCKNYISRADGSAVATVERGQG